MPLTVLICAIWLVTCALSIGLSGSWFCSCATSKVRKRSALAVFPDGPGSAVFFRLEPGELVLFRAASVVHGRTATTGEEFVNLLGLGYA